MAALEETFYTIADSIKPHALVLIETTVPYVGNWWELEKQDTCPHPDYSRARFFHRQDTLKQLRIEEDRWGAMKGADAVVIAVRHEQYLDLDPEKVFKSVGRAFAIIDCFCILDDDQIRKYLELGCEVKGLGRVISNG